MTHTKEVDPDSGNMPNYKNPASRLVHSLRKGDLRGLMNIPMMSNKYCLEPVQNLSDIFQDNCRYFMSHCYPQLARIGCMFQ